jgi:hypothetical protein
MTALFILGALAGTGRARVPASLHDLRRRQKLRPSFRDADDDRESISIHGEILERSFLEDFFG